VPVYRVYDRLFVTKKGFEVIILEAHTRIGGRIEQSPVQLEPQWN
jgi:monoamine oxidase